MKVSIVLWLFFSIPICLIFPGLRISLVSGQCLDDQRLLLLKFKNSLQYHNTFSTKLVHWNPSADCCSWKGVNCSGGHVVGLDLSSEFIAEGLNSSSSIFGLQYLQNLSLAYNNFNYSEIPSELDKLKNLTYLNLSNAGFAGQIPIAISRLTRLVILDLSALYFSTAVPLIKLENPNLDVLVQDLPELVELYLDGVDISAQGHEWCRALSFSLPKLRVLSLSSCNLSGPIQPSLLKLQSLSVMRLDNNNLSTPVPEFFSDFRSLTSLRLSSSGLNGTFPAKIFQVPKLETLDLSGNPDLSGSFPDFPRNRYLRTLVLSQTNFSGTLPDSIANLTMLSRLDLSSCNFSGSIPTSMANLTQLHYLDMSVNNFTGTIPSFSMARNLTQIHLSRNHLTGQITSTYWQELLDLVILDLRYNSLEGRIPVSLFSLSSLQKLQLSNNRFSGGLDQFSNGSYLLDTLDLSSNNLVGQIPISIFELRGLNVLSLSSNKFNGSLQLNAIQQLSNLSTLDLSQNRLLIVHNGTGSSLSSLTQITTLKLASCKLETFPLFLRNQSKLTTLDLSDNQIGGGIPDWIWKLPHLVQLNLSFNYLATLEGSLHNLSSLSVLDLRSNRLQGQLPVLPSFATYLDFSRNNFSYVIPASIGNSLAFTYFLSLASNKFYGHIPVSICNATYLQVIDLSNNSFSGTIPQCLIEMSGTLGVLNLRRNNLSGTIPDTFPHSCALQTLDLSGNQLEGKLPKSLADCTKLEVFNVGNNHLEDIFPCYLKNISMLRVLVLRSNIFKGLLGCPGRNFTWPMLQIVDVASNNFSGNFPVKNFSAWKAMIDGEDEARSELNHLQFKVLRFNQFYYQDSVSVTLKGLDVELVKVLTIFTSIDVSCNSLAGPLPEEVGVLKSLYVLNLSHNAFTGQIPISLADLTQLESLDLSSNKLTGNIPSQLAESLTFLSALNLSFNQLVGRIPKVKQFATFSNTSFEGNKGLCGFPLNATCAPNVRPPSAAPKSRHTSSRVLIGFDWQFILSGLGFGVGAAAILVPLMFWQAGRLWYDNRIDRILLVILPMMGLSYTGCADAKVEGEEDFEDDNIGDCDDENESEDGEFQERYCVFCSKLDISRKRVIHDPRCLCHNSPTISSSSSTSSSSS